MEEPFLTVIDDGKSVQERVDRFLRLHPGEMSAKTQVTTTAKCDMLGILPFDIEAIRVSVNFGIPIRSGKRKME